MVDDGRVLAAELEGDGSEVTSGGGHHEAADATAARKEDVVPALLKQGVGDRRAAFGHDHGLRVEVGRQELAQEGRSGWRQLGRFDSCRVAGRDGKCERQYQAAHRVVPRPDDEDGAKRFRHHFGPAGPQGPRHRDTAGVGPGTYLPYYALDIAPHGSYVGQPALEFRLGQIGRHGVGESTGLPLEEPYELAELGAPPRHRAGQAGLERRPELIGYRGEWSH